MDKYIDTIVLGNDDYPVHDSETRKEVERLTTGYYTLEQTLNDLVQRVQALENQSKDSSII